MPQKPKKKDPFNTGFQILNKWLFLKQRGLSLSSYFRDNCMETIAIYGMSSLGERLFDELKNSPVTVLYGVDRDAEKKRFQPVPLYDLNAEELPAADAIIVTPAQAYWEIARDLEALTDLPVLSLEDVVDYCYDNARNLPDSSDAC